MSALFRFEPGYEVVAEGASADAALEIVAGHRPDVLFLDLSMPGNVFEAITQISHSEPGTHVVVYTAFSSFDSVLKALDAGATGFVLKGGRVEEVLEAVEAVMNGEMFITKQYAGQVLTGLRNKSARGSALEKAVKLSVREKQIVQHLMHARTNREIASEMLLSEKTVKYYMSGLMNKLNARNRLEVVLEAQKKGSLD